MKIRFGVGSGAQTAAEELPAMVDRLEAAGIDSLWLSEIVYSEAVEPIVGMAFALSRTTRLKVGTSVAILPGRNPVLVAKQLASLAALAPKRVLPVFGLQPARPGERALFPVPEGKRGAVFDESLRLLRAALDGGEGPFTGEFFDVPEVALRPRSARPLDIWLGGSAPGAFRRIGRYGDGWLGSFLTAAEAEAGVRAIRAAAAEAGREIEPDHFGINLTLADGELPADLAAAIRGRRPDSDPRDLIAADWPALHRLIDGYLEAGLTKFVVTPTGKQPFDEFTERFAAELLPRQN
ncbi:TIGR03854 family LLM class F420-dependent oxidoreductase [Nocardia aurantia]|uniref:F420-dependent glucose-6-phosphate dehydrogenase n=1 Tax=Nocardia aurantia TaxID=2585199 RepID=A0A7K0E0Z1_9NOCA|nr:TIGR03854 family LLM class F420-dependent oxidoreductase [Nocardia aurantia]MQY31172.1 F420-dependent glucose-6-phosphate dehydrogenase [Nocardia aurantia]